MKIECINIKNFRRLLNNVKIGIDEQTLIVGKNNTGKTSVSEVVEKFLTTGSSFRFEDFSSLSVSSKIICSIYDEYERITVNFSKPLEKEQAILLEDKFPQITFDVVIKVEDDDNLADIKGLLYEFDNNEKIVIRLKYQFRQIKKCIEDFKTYNSKITEKNIKAKDKKLEELDFYQFVKRYFSNYYIINAYTTKPKRVEENLVDLGYVRNLFNVGIITAQREVDDTSSQNLQSISSSIWNYYEKITKENRTLNQEDVFKESTEEIKGSLNDSYNKIFEELIEQINKNVLNNEANQKVEITSEFNIEDVLKKNSKLKYSLDELTLPESYNGLGYSNMMYMTIQIITYKHKIDQEKRLFNILFIEEPESHLHPQMQATFLKRISSILECDFSISTIITTHSSYILQSAKLSSIRYFLVNREIIFVKSLREFFEKPGFASLETFLKKFFKINTCDLFFADKAILIEGSVERMLMPLFKEKLDALDLDKDNPITKQHITTLEVGGAYAHKFNELLQFLEIKTLIITDVDSVKGSHNEKCRCDLSNEGDDKSKYEIKTSNETIKNWFNRSGDKFYIKEILDECSVDFEEKKFFVKKNDFDEEIKRIAFQLPKIKETIWGRTFEEQFIIENSDFLCSKLKEDATISEESTVGKSINALTDAIIKAKVCSKCDSINELELVSGVFEIVDKIDKTNFAFDLMMLEGWKTPCYIEEGLRWLKNQ